MTDRRKLTAQVALEAIAEHQDAYTAQDVLDVWLEARAAGVAQLYLDMVTVPVAGVDW